MMSLISVKSQQPYTQMIPKLNMMDPKLNKKTLSEAQSSTSAVPSLSHQLICIAIAFHSKDTIIANKSPKDIQYMAIHRIHCGLDRPKHFFSAGHSGLNNCQLPHKDTVSRIVAAAILIYMSKGSKVHTTELFLTGLEAKGFAAFFLNNGKSKHEVQFSQKFQNYQKSILLFNKTNFIVQSMQLLNPN